MVELVRMKGDEEYIAGFKWIAASLENLEQ